MEDISSRIQLLEEKLAKENETRDIVPQSFGQSIRPNNLGQITPIGGRRKQLNLPFAQPPANVIEPETENKLQYIKERNGLLIIDNVKYKTDIQDLEHLGELGNGTSGHVVKMRHKQTGRIIAVKQMRRTGNTEETKRIIMDIDVVLKSHGCEYIVECLGCFITEMDVWICMELMATCFDKLLKKSNQPVPEDILGKVTVATVKALSYLKNEHGVIHRDIKPSNLLIDERGNIKLCDFGISGRLVDSKAKTRSAGCAAYMAPERIDPKKPEYDIRADVWSLGITLVELATGSFPYKGCKTDFEVLTRVLEADPPSLPTDKDFSIEFQTFVKKCLAKNYKERPKYPELQEQPFLKKYEQMPVDVAGWFACVMESSGIRSNCRNSPLPDTTTRLKTTSQIPNYQYNNSNNGSSLVNKSHSPSILTSSPSSSPPIHKPQLYKNAGTKHQRSNHDSHQQQPNHSNQTKQPDMNGAKSPPPLPKKQFYVQRNGYMKDENDIINEMNQMYMKSPFAQRRCQPSDGEYGSSPNTKMDAIYNNIAHNRNQKYFPGSPYLQRKYSQPQDSFWNSQHPPDGVAGSKSATTSPYARKRFQTTIPIAEQTQCTRPLGNTSPIVLQRFYHQQSQHRDKSERDRPTIDNTNPFLSHIPKYQFETLSSSPSSSNECQSPNISHTPPSYSSNIPTYQPQTNQNSQKNPFVYINSNHRKISSSPQNVYSELGGNNSGYGNQDVYSNNLYGRTMSKIDGKSTAVNGKNDSVTKEDQGWFNSIAGVVKRRFASYVKLNLTSGDKKQEKDANSSSDKRSSQNPASYGTAGSQLPVSPMIYPQSPHILNSDRRHHRSPDPPPRFNRGQSPLVLRRNLLEYGQSSSGSPLLPRRLTSSSPPLPPRRSSESVPGSPQHFRTKIHYTPEPQRRMYRSIDQ
ncbi:Dual specificity mitogen-activated protein kinase kinase hemipterous [Pseudolycoriella hygida]|uniref:mitogen-activated protein kinase kinase n=1 Tax=Pseudolycoriella hygida TaxID=35572 RepID=A0A9Q0MQT9_9DIPT|nr:Dual specificity mitogen-activated protein kinase kinase hemipterous [Pseudolycoriella hygida]